MQSVNFTMQLIDFSQAKLQIVENLPMLNLHLRFVFL